MLGDPVRRIGVGGLLDAVTEPEQRLEDPLNPSPLKAGILEKLSVSDPQVAHRAGDFAKAVRQRPLQRRDGKKWPTRLDQREPLGMVILDPRHQIAMPSGTSNVTAAGKRRCAGSSYRRAIAACSASISPGIRSRRAWSASMSRSTCLTSPASSCRPVMS